MTNPAPTFKRCAARTLGLALAGLACLPQARADEGFFETFEAGTLNPLLYVEATPGFSLAFANGQAAFNKAAGTGNGYVFLWTAFQGTGDFVTSVQANRTGLGSGEMGLFVDYGNPNGQGNRIDIFFVRNNQITANITTPGSPQTSVQAGNGAASLTFQITRVGSTVSAQFDTGSGMQTLQSRTSPDVVWPARFSLFLSQEFNGTDANTGSFDNWSITAANVPEPGAAMLMLTGMGVMLWARRRARAACLRVATQRLRQRST